MIERGMDVVSDALMAFANGIPIRCATATRDGAVIIDPSCGEISETASAVMAQKMGEDRLGSSALLDIEDGELSFGATFLMDPASSYEHMSNMRMAPDEIAVATGGELARALVCLVPPDGITDRIEHLTVTILMEELASIMSGMPGVTVSDAVAFSESERSLARGLGEMPDGDWKNAIGDSFLSSDRREDLELIRKHLGMLSRNRALFHALGHSVPVDLAEQMRSGRTIFLRIPSDEPVSAFLCLTAILSLGIPDEQDVACHPVNLPGTHVTSGSERAIAMLRHNAIEWGLSVRHEDVEQRIAERAELIRTGDWEGLRSLSGKIRSVEGVRDSFQLLSDS